MDKTLKIYIGLFVLAVLAMFFYESSKPKPINWYPSYVKKHKIPYGTYILYHELEDLFPEKEIKDIPISPYIYLKNKTREGTYLFIDESINFDEETFNLLLDFVASGNEVFLSTKGCNIDTLGLKTKAIYKKKMSDKPYFKLYNAQFGNKEYSFDRYFKNVVFSEIDTTKVRVLGQSGYIDQEGNRTNSGINFIKYPYGKGNFYFHTFPEAFTNYQLLNSPNETYASDMLSYINTKDQALIWDAYYKTGKSRISSPMHYILSQKSLKWAYFFILMGVLFFIIFEGKRKQRSIPILSPLKNQTLAFTRTIANMYFEKQEHKNIAEHKIQYLLEYIRTKHRMATDTIDAVFIKNLSARSNHSEESVTQLFNYIAYIHKKNKITPLGLEELNKMIERFKDESK